MNRGMRLGRLAGVEIFAGWSLLIVFSLVTISLAGGLLPGMHPQWSAALNWSVALLGAVMFFGSILLHELSHAVVGRVGGVSVRRITLFVFGGMAHMENEPPTWRSELSMALAGPVTSLLIGAACLWASGLLAVAPQATEGEVLRSIQVAGPMSTLLMWLGSINIVLGLFNLVPGFPLDGGRILRAAAWGITGNFARATRFAAGLGQVFGWLLIAAGLTMMLGGALPLLGRGLVSGLWLALIGWFLNSAALSSSRRLTIQNALEDVPVTRIMRTTLQSVAPDTTVATLIDRYAIASGQQVFPVVQNDQLMGIANLRDVQAVPAPARAATTVATLMKPAGSITTLAATESAKRAADLLARPEVEEVLVTDDGRVIGVIGRDSMMLWLSLNRAEERDAAPARRQPA